SEAGDVAAEPLQSLGAGLAQQPVELIELVPSERRRGGKGCHRIGLPRRSRGLVRASARQSSAQPAAGASAPRAAPAPGRRRSASAHAAAGQTRLGLPYAAKRGGRAGVPWLHPT